MFCASSTLLCAEWPLSNPSNPPKLHCNYPYVECNSIEIAPHVLVYLRVASVYRFQKYLVVKKMQGMILGDLLCKIKKC